MFYRFNRYRSLKTRAKQIDKLRRQSRWDWDAAQRPFFNAKHVRCASHFGSPKYHPRKLDGDDNRGRRPVFAEEDSSKLTEGEKMWEKEMERLRTRIERDPYETVFGKRFQPFWGPLLNPLLRWTGEETGHKTDTPTGNKTNSTGSSKAPEPAKVEMPIKNEKKDRDLDADTPNGQLTNYSYTASTAWDSNTNKTRRQEWDSTSGMTKSFEYDPITNRMRQVEMSPSSSTAPSSSKVKSESSTSKPMPICQRRSRMPIKVPTTNVDDVNKTAVYFPSLLNTTIAASPAKTSAITKAPESNIELLTAEDIRASMRNRQDQAHNSISPSSAGKLQPAVQRMQTKELPEVDELDDSAAHESTGDGIQYNNVPRDWEQQSDLLQTNRILRTRPVANSGLGEEQKRTPADSDPTLDRFARFKPPTVFPKGREVEDNGHKIENDQLTRTPFDNDHTLVREGSNFKPPTVFKNRCKAEENGHKVNEDTSRPRSPRESDHKKTRLDQVGDATTADEQSKYQRKIKELKRQLDLSYEQSLINSEMHVERIRELERALQNARDNAASTVKGAEHTQGEGDFDISVSKYAKDGSRWYKMPAHQPKAKLESDVRTADQPNSTQSVSAVSRDPVVKNALARTEKQHGITYNGATKKDTAELMKEMAEKDRQIRESRAGRNPFPDPHLIKVDKEMSEKHKHKPQATTQLLADYAEKDRQIHEISAGRNPFPDPNLTKVDKEMVKKTARESEDTKQLLADYAEQDRQIRESRAGRNPFPDPLSIEVDKEMAEKYKIKPEDTKKLLEADAKREKEWENYVAKKKLSGIPAGIESTSRAAVQDIRWAEPPVYKVLAYDSGNDLFSIATTSSNFTTHETPISIQDSLSQLYQPARFVPHFADLQKEGYHVIYGTKDLLLFRKRHEVKPMAADQGFSKYNDTPAEPMTSLTEPISSNSGGASAVAPSYVSPGCPNHKDLAPVKAEHVTESVRNTLHDSKKLNEAKQNPRVHREERVFSGRKKGGRHRSELTAEEIKLLRTLKGNDSGWASRLRWALSVGIGASAVAYGVGVAVEKKEARDREHWEDILESRYKRRSS